MGHCHIEPGTLPATFVDELTVLWQPVLPVELNAPLEPAADFAKAQTAPATQAAYGSGCRNSVQHRQAAVDIPAKCRRPPGRGAWTAGTRRTD